MQHSFTRFSLFAFFLLSFSVPFLSAQEEGVLWPGDANNSGEVNGVDFLYYGYAYGLRGELRPGASTDWVAQAMGSPWEKEFPGDNLNAAYADGDGNGSIDRNDFRALSINYGRQQPTGSEPTGNDNWQRPDTSATPAGTLALVPTGVQLSAEGNFLTFEVSLNGPDSTYEHFYGLSLRASFPAGMLRQFRDYDKENLAFDFGDANRLGAWLQVDSARQELTLSYTGLNAQNRVVDGAFARLSLPLAADFPLDSLSGKAISIDSLVLRDEDFTLGTVAVQTIAFDFDTDCSLTVSPVCGDNGVTYLNGCFAEAAGVLHYTAGACWNPGLNPDAIVGSPDCPAGYSPVCGFNGVTYSSPCRAEAAGVTNYTPGLCDPNDMSCYDANLIVISSGTSLNQTTGVLTLDCPAANVPVCGCDGEQYANACLAEAAGVRSYTTGGCDAACIDPGAITDTDDCGTETAFVCGCNDETYINACFAEAAGVQSYSSGPCNGSSGWCDEATVITCGDYLPNETTIGAGNQLTSYPGASSLSFLGPDRVYAFEKTTAGDLQVGLEIMTSGLNMDLFLIRGDCNNYTVVGASTHSNNQTNNEGIVINDAPNGTYYIVVDQLSAGIGGNYRLELSCGYLDCSDRVPLTCGVTYNGTNLGGNDDVSTYTCGPTLNVENNGPEIVHSFTTTEAGLVTIDLTGLSANLELFLLSECSRRSGLQYSQNAGTSDEQIVRHLPAGTYYVVVDGYNGAVSNYSLTVDCSSDCDMGYEVLGQTGSACGSGGGSFTFRVLGGSPTYSAHYVGPVCRAAVSATGVFTFTHLPPGNYFNTITDGNGCELVFPFTISADGGGIDGHMTPTPAGCGESGRIDVALTTPGTAPYVVTISGDHNQTFATASSQFVINPLSAGNYVVTVTDANGCSFSESVVVATTDGNLDVTTTPRAAGCGGTLGEIGVHAPNGTLPYTLHVTGPVTGGRVINRYSFRVINLPAGTYQFQLTDAFGCSYTETITIAGGELEADVSATPANCDLPGAIRVNIGVGQAPYTINYSGPLSGTVTTSNPVSVLSDLPSGTYNLSIWDANGCDRSETVFVDDNGGNLNFTVSQLTAACDGNDSQLQLLIAGGQPNYTVTYTGSTTGSLSIDGTGVANLSLPPGNYTLTATDFGNCSSTQQVTVLSGLSSGDQSSFAYGSGCGQLDNIRTILNSGEAPFIITVTTDACPEENRQFVSQTRIFELTDLPNCTYNIGVQDANGCTISRTVTIDVDPNADFLVLNPNDGACGGLGSIMVNINAGEGPYFIDWVGPVSGNVALVAQDYLVSDLPAGTYTFTLTNAAGCDATASVTLLNDGSLDVISSIVTDDCGRPDQIWNDIEGGNGPYEVTVTRLCDGTEVDEIMSGEAGFEIVDLIPCDYKIVVTDVNGCMTMTTVTVEPYQLFDAIVTDGVCGQFGAVRINVTNASTSGPYDIRFTGPAVGNTSDTDGDVTIPLPGGTYVFLVTSAEGCVETETVTINEIPSDLDLQTALIQNDCGQYNQLWNDINGGVAPYTIVATRLCDGVVDTTFTTSDNGFELFDLDECCYRVTVTDARGCTAMTERCVEDSTPNLVDLSAVSGPCGENGRIDLNFVRGQAPYNVTYVGPQSGDNNTVNGNQLSVNDVPAGNYVFTVTDANGCTETESITVEPTTSNLELSAALIYNDCGQYNQIWIDIFNGTGPFSIEVIRLCDGTTLTEFISGDVGFELTDLEACDYKIIVTDAAGCMVMDVITVFPAPIDLVDVVAVSGECNELGSFDLTVLRGTAPYTIVYSGPVSDSLVTSATSLRRDDLPSGNYTMFVTDAIGCSETVQFTIQNTTTDLDLVTSIIFNDCGQPNQLWNDINGGVPPYTVEVTRLCDNVVDTTFVTNEVQFELFDRLPCEYKLKVTDATGCMDMENAMIQSTSANLFDLTVNNSCDNSGFGIDFIAGAPPYRVVIAGPVVAQFENVTDDMFFSAPPGDYSVRVWSAENCSEANFRNIDGSASGELPNIAFSAAVNGLTASFTNTSTGTDFSWNFGDGSPAVTDADPEHVYSTAGTYNVCLTVANGCGSNTACQTVQVASGGGVQVVIGQATSSVNNTVRLPVSIQGAENLATIAGTFAVADENIATISHLSAGMINPQFNADNNSFSFVANGTDGIDLDGPIDVLFFVHLNVGANLGTTAVGLTDQPVSFEVSGVRSGTPVLLNASHLPGAVEVAANVLGNISSMASNRAGEMVDNTTFQLSEDGGGYTIDLPMDNGIASTLTGLSMGRMYYVEPIKTTDYRNGISSFEIFLGQRYLLGYDVPQIEDPLQVVALDVNCSQSFTNLDLFLMQRLLVDELDALPDCNSWTFVPNSHAFPSDWPTAGVFPAPRRAEVMLTSSDTMVTFTAVKTGDLLGDADPQRSRADLPLDVSLPAVLSPGRQYVLPLHLRSAAQLVSFQGELQLPDDLEIVSVAAGELTDLHVSDRLADRGLLRLSWFAQNGTERAFAPGAMLLEVTVRPRRRLAAAAVDLAFTDDRSFPAAAHDDRYRPLRPVINAAVTDQQVEFGVTSVAPNPASDFLDVTFGLPVAGSTQLLLHDALGRPVLRREQTFAAGRHTLRLDTRFLPAGVYHYRLGADGAAVTGKVIISR